MAFTRKFLAALGIEGDKIDEIISAHAEVVDGLKSERDELKAKTENFGKVQKELDEAKAKIAKYGDGEPVSKADYDKIKKEYEEYKTEVESKKTHSAKVDAFREMFKAAGFSENKIDVLIKHSKIDDAELTEDGKIKDQDKLTKEAQEDFPEYLEEKGIKGADFSKPPKDGGTKKDDFELGFDGE